MVPVKHQDTARVILERPDLAASVEVRSVASEFLRLRPLLVGPLFAFTVLVLGLTSAPRAQVIAIGCAGTLFMGFFIWERAHYRVTPVSVRALRRSLLLTLLGIGVGTTATGASASPLVAMLFAPVGVGFAAFGRRRESAELFGALVVIASLLGALGMLASPIRALEIAPPARSLILLAAIVDAALLLRVAVTHLAEAHRRAAATLAAASDEVVRAAGARAETLEMLGARVAHEVKNPLAAIRAIVELTQERAAGDASAEKRLAVAAAEIARIEQILDGYRALHHPLDVIDRRPTNVAELVRELVAVLEARAVGAGIALAARVPPEGCVIEVDADRVKEALLNVLINALTATPRGGLVEACVEESSSDVDVRVIDTGEGMDAETLAKIGTPFYTRRRSSGGTGLGVALARRIAVEHGGALTFSSEVGQGTTATMRLPRTNRTRSRGH